MSFADDRGAGVEQAQRDREITGQEVVAPEARELALDPLPRLPVAAQAERQRDRADLLGGARAVERVDQRRAGRELGMAPGVDQRAAEEAAQQEQQMAQQQLTPEELEALRREQEQQQAMEQWLRRIPNDPGGLLRRKFRYQYQKTGKDQDGNNTWPDDEVQPW